MKREEKVDVSIIVTVYNHEKYIAQALTSIVTQETEYTYEILVGEDKSPDRSKDIIREFEKKYPEKIRAFYREENLGATKNGYELGGHARGRYMAALDGDDYWTDKHKIQKQVSFLDKHMEYIGVACNFSTVDKEGNIVEERMISDERLNRKFTWKDFLERGFEFQTGTFLYRNIYLDGKDYSIFYKAHDLVGDLTALTILLNKGDVYVMGDVMSAYRKVRDVTASNACSIAARDRALAEIKTVRQYVMLKSYLNDKRDFNRRISESKMGFIIGMMKRKKGYTWKRWKKMKSLGGFYTNLLAIVFLLRECLRHLFIYIMREKNEKR